MVLDGINLELAAAEALAVVGPSGSGKSTLLQIIGTLDHPTSGQVLLDGQDVNQMDELELAAIRNHKLGFVFQSHYLLPQCTVLENVLVPTLARSFKKSSSPAHQKTGENPSLALGQRVGARASPGSDSSVPPNESHDARERLLKRVGLGERVNHRPGELSGGERQRVAVVRALINRPRLLLADEPTGSLDHASAQSLAQLLLELNQEEGVTLIVVTHARDLAQRMGRVLELEDGKWKPTAQKQVTHGK